MQLAISILWFLFLLCFAVSFHITRLIIPIIMIVIPKQRWKPNNDDSIRIVNESWNTIWQKKFCRIVTWRLFAKTNDYTNDIMVSMLHRNNHLTFSFHWIHHSSSHLREKAVRLGKKKKTSNSPKHCHQNASRWKNFWNFIDRYDLVLLKDH